MSILKIAISCPLRQTFDYLDESSNSTWEKGCRVLVPFGSRKLVGVVIDILTETSKIDKSKLKPIIKRLDSVPSIPTELFNLII